MNKRNSSAGTNDEQRITAESGTSASLVQNGLLSDVLPVEEGNKLIAIFMDFVVKDFGAAYWRYTFSDNEDAPYYDWFMCRDLEYNSSWDWLMPVVEKIKKYWFDDNCEAHKVCSLSIVTQIEDVWKAVVEFIKWYNAQNNKSM